MAYTPTLVTLGPDSLYGQGLVPNSYPPVFAGGTGYMVNDVITISGGSASANCLGPFETSYVVNSVGGGGNVNGLTRDFLGCYGVLPTLTGDHYNTTGGSGSGVEIDPLLSFNLNSWVKSPIGGGFPASFSQMTASMWMCNADINNPIIFQANGTSDQHNLIQINFSVTSGTPYLNTYDASADILIKSGNVVLYTGTVSGTYSPNVFARLVNILVSIDTSTQSLQLFVCDVEFTLTSGVGWIGPAAIDNSTGDFRIYASSPFGLNLGSGDWWVDERTVDFSDVTNRRKFINSDKTAVDLGSDGSAPFGSSPIIWLHTTTTADDFVTNHGTGGAWSVWQFTALGLPTIEYEVQYASLALYDPTNICVFAPPPAPKLNMDNVLVLSLLTESPCTAVQFNPAPTVTPSFGLRWSDTRGATWGNAVPQEFSSSPLSQPQWNRLGMARDRVFELFWSASFNTALNGAFVEVAPLKS